MNMLSAFDAAVLVVAAGEAKRGDLEGAQQVFESCSVTLLGTVLNKQSDPVPDLFSRLF
jgi:hypothetical protein